VVIRRAKIVCTIGPASDPPDALLALMEAGMNVARLNFSHGSHEEHEARIRRIREVAAASGHQVAILQDLCGPKIRCGLLAGGGFTIETGQRVRLVEAGPETPKSPIISVQYPGLAEDLEPGDVVLVDDGRIGLEVAAIEDGAVIAEVTQGGTLRDKVGVHLPAERVRIETLTEKDKRDLSFGLAHEVDYVALSFVRNAAEVHRVRDICEAWGRPTPVVSKIETPQAVEHLEGIILASDAVMVARGDLGVEFPPEYVPVIQREILGLARRHERQVIVATEMMQSMVTSTRPTRAEASDVATAVFDGTDAVMLSGETATGAHPPLVVRTMHRIVVEAEQSAFYAPPRPRPEPSAGGVHIAQAIARGACQIAEDVRAKVIVAFTESGRTARFVSQARPGVPIIGLSANPETLRKLCLFWGVVPWQVEPSGDSDAMIDRAHALLLAHGIVSPGDKFVTIFGAPVGVSGSTNALQVKVIE
jgi:pyruvate kinase